MIVEYMDLTIKMYLAFMKQDDAEQQTNALLADVALTPAMDCFAALDQ